MLRRLSIVNYALIEQIEIDLQSGLSIITGETGAGKSIVIGALSLILGQRADVKVIRDLSKKTVVEAVFDIRNYDLSGFFEQNNIDYFPAECIIRREISPTGRTRAFVNDTPVTLGLLTELSQSLIDIHSQHSNALLLTPAYQLKVIDNLAGNKDVLHTYQDAYAALVSARRDYETAKSRIEKNKADEEYFRFQLNQLESACLSADEQDTLEKEKSILENLTLLRNNLSAVCSILNDGNASVIEALSDAERQIATVSGVYDGALELEERINSSIIEIKDIYETVSKDFQNIGDDASGLDAIEERLSLIYSLQQKFHVNTVAELLEIEAGLRQSLLEIDNSEEELTTLKENVIMSEANVGQLANKLTEARKTAASLFLSSLKRSISTLGLKNFLGEILFEQIGFCPTGQDRIKFNVSFNINQKPMPIDSVASGGEISRVMLCIKALIAEKMQLPTIVFDEIDTGVSGEVANKIGGLMEKISRDIQVITITHLPQVAALGVHHYKVYKEDSATETITNMKELDAEGRIRELAGMLSGAVIDNAAVENAKSLLMKTN